VPLLPAPSGDIDYLITGAGLPVTVFAHGLGGSIADTRPLASGVAGTRVFFHFRGHGATTASAGVWTYADLAAELLSVADHCTATRALGVSMGAGAILRILLADPTRFERAVLFLPAVLDHIPPDAPYEKVDRLAEAIETGDVDRVASLLLADQPDGVRSLPQAVDYVRDRAESLVGTSVAQALREIPRCTPVSDRAELARIGVPILVIAQEGNPVHLVSIAEEVAAALPNAQLHVFPEHGAIWLARDRLRNRISNFLNA
jgi:pimeloyl-ACP methyl ester carboxylesterase